MATEYAEVEVWVAVDAEGSACVASDEGDLDTTELSSTSPVRVVKLTVRVPLPRVLAAKVTVPAEDESGELAVTLE